MSKTAEEIKDLMEEIQNRNYSKFKGSNEADLMVREEIYDLFSQQLAEREKEIEMLKKYCASEGALNSVQRMKLDKVERDKIKFSEEQNIKLHEENEELIILIDSQQSEIQSLKEEVEGLTETNNNFHYRINLDREAKDNLKSTITTQAEEIKKLMEGISDVLNDLKKSLELDKRDSDLEKDWAKSNGLRIAIVRIDSELKSLLSPKQEESKEVVITEPCGKCGKECTGRSCHDCQYYW